MRWCPRSSCSRTNDEKNVLVLIVQPVSGRSPTKDSVLAILDGKIAKWWMPDDVVLVDEIPLGPTGKNNKLALRDQFKDFELST